MSRECAEAYAGGPDTIDTLMLWCGLNPVSRGSRRVRFSRESIDRALDKQELMGKFPSRDEIREEKRKRSKGESE